MTEDENKRRFLIYELGLLSLKAALSTRDDKFPIYSSTRKLHQRSGAKKAFRSLLAEIEYRYANAQIPEADHIRFIEETANSLSAKLKPDLHKGRLRIGVAQKLINLHLKYLWTAGFCPEPPHCPIDGIIRDEANIEYNWTQSDCIKDYQKAIERLKQIARIKGQSLSQWELDSFRRRDDRL